MLLQQLRTDFVQSTVTQETVVLTKIANSNEKCDHFNSMRFVKKFPLQQQLIEIEGRVSSGKRFLQ